MKKRRRAGWRRASRRCRGRVELGRIQSDFNFILVAACARVGGIIIIVSFGRCFCLGITPRALGTSTVAAAEDIVSPIPSAISSIQAHYYQAAGICGIISLYSSVYIVVSGLLSSRAPSSFSCMTVYYFYHTTHGTLYAVSIEHNTFEYVYVYLRTCWKHIIGCEDLYHTAA